MYLPKLPHWLKPLFFIQHSCGMFHSSCNELDSVAASRLLVYSLHPSLPFPVYSGSASKRQQSGRLEMQASPSWYCPAGLWWSPATRAAPKT